MQASCDSLHTEVWALPGVLAMMLPGVRVMIERWGLPGCRSPVPLLLSPLVQEEPFRVLGCSGGLMSGRPRLCRVGANLRHRTPGLGKATESGLDTVGVGLHGQALEDLKGLVQVRGARLGLAVAQAAFAAALQREGFVIELACLPG